MAEHNISNQTDDYSQQNAHSKKEIFCATDLGVLIGNSSVNCGYHTLNYILAKNFIDPLSRSSQSTTVLPKKDKWEIQLWLNNILNHRTDFSTLVVELLETKGYKNNYPLFYNEADIDRRLFSKIITTKSKYHPEIKTVFKIIIGLELDLEQANELLNSASYSFGNSLFNLVIQYCVENHVYDHKTIDEYLMEFCGKTLYSTEKCLILKRKI